MLVLCFVYEMYHYSFPCVWSPLPNEKFCCYLIKYISLFLYSIWKKKALLRVLFSNPFNCSSKFSFQLFKILKSFITLKLFAWYDIEFYFCFNSLEELLVFLVIFQQYFSWYKNVNFDYKDTINIWDCLDSILILLRVFVPTLYCFKCSDFEMSCIPW